MKKLNTTGAATRNSFISEFAFGDKTQAIRDLCSRSASSHRFDGVTSDDFIYEALAFSAQAEARAMRCL